MRFPDWPRGVAAPGLLDIIVQTDGPEGDPAELERAYEVFGVFETRTGYRLHCERVAFDRYTAMIQTALDLERDPRELGVWTFYNLPRR